MKSISMRVALLFGLVTGTVSLAAANSSERHLALVKTEPGQDSTVVVAPTSLRLFWTEPPTLAATAVRLTSASEATIELGEPKADEADAKIVNVELAGRVMPGVYTVTWRTAGDDGHVIDGTYQFTYRAAKR